jgi:2-polyprenyl-3-methyl-5-hydroxy-6-metoxy-1,4-benzoquinol methylase
MDLSPPRQDGQIHPAYANPRAEVTPLIPQRAHRILDLGCSAGVMGEALRHRGRHVVGVELDPQLAALARARLDQVVEGDVERLAREGADVGAPFDCVVCADVLEHLRDPWSVVRWAAGLLTPEGCLVISVPNIRHAQTLWNLAVRRRWPYRDVGIFDRTHLRWFARANLADLLGDTGLAVTELRRSYLFTLNYGSRWNRLAKYCGDLGTLQFIFRAERDGSGGQRGSR